MDNTVDDGHEKDAASHKKSKIRHHTIYSQLTFPQSTTTRFIESEITSSLSLQRLLYFNFFYSMIFFVLYLGNAVFRWHTFTSGSEYIFNLLRLILIFVPWLLVEFFRLQNGYEGNLGESFPEIISFLLQTIFNFAVNIAFVIFPNNLPLELSLIIIQLVFMSFELIICFTSISQLTRAQSALFFWKSPYGKSKKRKKEDIQIRDKAYQEIQQEDMDDKDTSEFIGTQYLARRNLNNTGYEKIE